MAHETSEPAGRLAALVFLDWGNKKHDWALAAADAQRIEQGELANTPQAIEAWAVGLAQRFPGQTVAVGLESNRNVQFHLLQYGHLVLFPTHPATLARYRKAFRPSGAKDDPSDAVLGLELLRLHREQLPVWQPDTVETRRLQFLVEDRRRLVDDKTQTSNRLTARLKLYFPQILAWFTEVDTPMLEDFLRRWPTLEKVQQAAPRTLRQFFHQHNSRSNELLEKRLRQIREAVPATLDPAVRDASVTFVLALLGVIAALRQAIAESECQIAVAYDQHPDAPLFRALPAAGPALGPRLLVAMGTRRERFTSAGQVHCCSGIAPVLQRSGQTQIVHLRHACNKFVRQTFHEWAACTIRVCDWARAFYDHQRALHKGHHAAVRALAFKWIRIVYRCWKDRVPYDEARYLQALQRRQAPKANPAAFRWNQVAGGFHKFAGSGVS
ncbi:MAG: IS110 family transposase, partial [Terriglobales bacterium]